MDKQTGVKTPLRWSALLSISHLSIYKVYDDGNMWIEKKPKGKIGHTFISHSICAPLPKKKRKKKEWTSNMKISFSNFMSYENTLNAKAFIICFGVKGKCKEKTTINEN